MRIAQATSALGSMRIAQPPEASAPPPAVDEGNRLMAAQELEVWLTAGGPQPVQQCAPDAPPLLHMSDAFELTGTESNLTFVVRRPVAAGHFVIGVALSSVLHSQGSWPQPSSRSTACATQRV